MLRGVVRKEISARLCGETDTQNDHDYQEKVCQRILHIPLVLMGQQDYARYCLMDIKCAFRFLRRFASRGRPHAGDGCPPASLLIES